MVDGTRFKQLNDRVLAHEATADERTEWETKKAELQHAYEGPDGRRAFQRIAVHMPVEVPTSGGWKKAQSYSLGAGGLGVVGSFDLPVGQELELRICLPGRMESESVSAQVVWIDPEGRLGLKFVRPPADLQRRIDVLVWEECGARKL